MLTLTKLSETTTTMTLGWDPPAGVGGYAFYAAGEVVSVATRNMKDNTPRNTVKFAKSPLPVQVAAICRLGSGVFSVEVGAYPIVQVFPEADLFPSEVRG